MYLLIVILLTSPGTMSEPFVSATKTEAECLRALPLAVEVAEKAKTIGYVAACIRAQRAGV